MMQEPSLFDVVTERLLTVAMPGLTPDAIRPDSRLIEDLGLDSIKFVDLTVALEKSLRLNEFPMQQWVDEETTAGKPLTVGSLVAACERLVRAS